MNTTNIPQYKASNPLQTAFVTNADKSGDNIFRQIKRDGKVCLYSRSNMEGRVLGYEVFVVKVVKAGTVYVKGGKPTENDAESYPGGAGFKGNGAKFTNNLGRAEQIFEEMVKKETQKSEPANPVTVHAVTMSKEVAEESHDIPTGEFTQATFASVNCMPPRGVVYNVLQHLIVTGKVKLSRSVQMGPGRPTNLYVKS